MHETFTTKLYGPNGLVFIGTQAGCAQAVKDCGLPAWRCVTRGLNRYERQRIMAKGKPLTGKAKAYFQTHRM